MEIPGFTADRALGSAGAHRGTAAGRRATDGECRLIPQMRSEERQGAGGPFSGSCGCGQGFCCCILCYFGNGCNFWCWLTYQGGLVRI